MSASYICASCRYQLSRRSATLLKRNGPAFASFITLSGQPSTPSAEKSATPDEKSRPTQETKDEQDDFFVRSPEEQGLLEHLSQQRSRGSDQALESLFESFNARPAKSTPTTASQVQQKLNPTTVSTTRTKAENAIEEIKEQMDRKEIPVKEIWKLIDTAIIPAANDQTTKDAMRASSNVFHSLIPRTVATWCLAQSSDAQSGVPTPSQLREKYWTLNIISPHQVAEIVLPLLRFIYTKEKEVPQWSTTIEGRRVMNALMNVWTGIFKNYVDHQGLVYNRRRWPTPDSLRKIIGKPPWNFTDSFHDRFFKYFCKLTAQRKSLLPSAALLSLHVLGRRLNLESSESITAKEYPFLMLVSSMASRAPGRFISQPVQQILEQNLDPQVCADALEELKPIIARLKALATAQLERRNQTNEQGDPKSVSEVMKIQWFKRIARAEEAHDGARLRRLWVDARAEFSTPRNTSALSMPPEIFEFFLRTAFKTRQLELVAEIWQSMITSFGKITRTMTWNTLLQMCQLKKDTVALEETWQAMLSHGAQPNSISWAIRIQRMLDSRKIPAGLAMLDEMDKIWLNAAMQQKGLSAGLGTKGLKAADMRALREERLDVPVARVDTNVVNVVVTALLRLRRNSGQFGPQVPSPHADARIKRVLDWAAGRGVQPDTNTYNLFIGDALHYENRREVSRILKTMEQRGIQPDSYTFSHLLNARFRSDASQGSEEDLAASVSEFLGNMEQLGATINSHHYTILIDGLLKRHNNPRAAQAVLAYMRTNGMQPTPYIYTTMANWYFNQDPPALDAVAALCESMKHGDHLHNVSAVFYGRVIEGYARVGDLSNMMAMFNQLEKDKRAPTWRALEVIIDKFVEIGDRALADRIVEDIRSHSGPMQVGIHGTKYNRRRFWKRMFDLGFEFKDDQLEQYDADSTSEPLDFAKTTDDDYSHSNFASSQSIIADEPDPELQSFLSDDKDGHRDTKTSAEHHLAS